MAELIVNNISVRKERIEILPWPIIFFYFFKKFLNWRQWADNMEAYLNTKELWEYVDGTMPKPVPGNPSNPTAKELDKLANWKRKAGKASGEIWLAIEDDQKVHVKDGKGDPTAMWVKLESVHVQKRPGACFNAYDSLFSIRKNDDET